MSKHRLHLFTVEIYENTRFVILHWNDFINCENKLVWKYLSLWKYLYAVYFYIYFFR